MRINVNANVLRNSQMTNKKEIRAAKIRVLKECTDPQCERPEHDVISAEETYCCWQARKRIREMEAEYWMRLLGQMPDKFQS
jgi:hypothetical protein